MTARAQSLNFRQLEIFAAAARQGSFTRAARMLLLSESAVSQQIKLLERTVGTRLFDRIPRRPIRLTEAGSLLLQTYEKIFQELEATLREMEALRGLTTSRVSFGVGTCFGNYVLPPIIAAFHNDNPGIPVTVNSEMVGHWAERVRRHELDLAVVTGGTTDDELTSIPFAQKDLVWIVSSRHRLAGQQMVSIEALKDEPLIVGPSGSSSRKALQGLVEARGVTMHPAFELAGNEACITAVASGMGVALVPYQTALSRELAKSVAFLHVEGFPLRLDWSLVWRTNDLSPAAATFRDYLLGAMHEVIDVAADLMLDPEEEPELQLA